MFFVCLLISPPLVLFYFILFFPPCFRFIHIAGYKSCSFLSLSSILLSGCIKVCLSILWAFSTQNSLSFQYEAIMNKLLWIILCNLFCGLEFHLSRVSFPLLELLFSFFKCKFIYFNWRLITLQYCIGFAIHQHYFFLIWYLSFVLKEILASSWRTNFWQVGIYQDNLLELLLISENTIEMRDYSNIILRSKCRILCQQITIWDLWSVHCWASS